MTNSDTHASAAVRRGHLARGLIGVTASVGLLGGALVATAAVAAATPPVHETVSTTGTDSGNCVQSPCATINYAIAQASPGEGIYVEPGSYNQTVDVTKSVTLQGAGASRTTIDGTGLDPTGQGYYGVVYVGDAGGAVTIKGFTITNPYPDSYTGGEPEAVALADHNSSDLISILDNNITEGTSDPNASSDFPIGIDTFLNAATTYVAHSTISGFFQGALLEDNGPALLASDTFSAMIANTYSGVTYPGEGVFFLADEQGTYTQQEANNNTFTGYSGYGIAESAGYTGGNCTSPCTGGLSSTLNGNNFALTGGQTAAGIALTATGAPNADNNLTATLTGNHGYVTAPSQGIQVQAVSGGTLNVSENNDNIATRSGGAMHPVRGGGLHRPTHRG